MRPDKRKSLSLPASESTAGSATVSTKPITIQVCRDPGPIVCAFPSGLPSTIDEENAEDRPKFSLKVSKSSNKTFLLGSDTACKYSAGMPNLDSNNDKDKERKNPPHTDERSTRMYVGVYDSETGTLTLQKSAADGYVFALSQAVTDYQSNTMSSSSGKNYNEKRRSLVEDFGTAKKRKVLRSREANAVNVDTVVGAGSAMVDNIIKGDNMSASNRAAIEKRLNESEHKQAEDNIAEEWRQRFLPTYNKDAKSANNVYSARDMAGNMAWDACRRIIHACMKQNDVVKALTSPRAGHDKSEWFPLIIAILNTAPPVNEGKARKEFYTTVSLLQYWSFLFVKLGHKKSFQGPHVEYNRYNGVPAEVGRRFVTLFSTPVTARDGSAGFVMSKANKDRCCMHLLLLLLMVDRWNEMKSDRVSDFSTMLKIDTKESSQLLRLAGCTVVSRSSVSSGSGTSKVTATLRVPLTFPAMKKKISQKKAS